MITRKYYKLIRVSHEDSEYLRIKNVSNENGVFKMVRRSGYVYPNMQYSLDGVNWTTYNFDTLPEVTVEVGSNIYLRGTNSGNQFNKEGDGVAISDARAFSISFNKTCEAHGNVCSLFNPDPATFSAITSIGAGGLEQLFYGCTTLTTPPNFGNVTTVGKKGLNGFFVNCGSLTTAPDMSNITTVDSSSMENGSLREMFTNCTSLVKGPDFSSITSIGTANYAIYHTFGGCIKLEEATTPNLQDLTGKLYNWLNNAGTQATGTKVVRVPTGATITTDSPYGIPTGWTRVDY